MDERVRRAPPPLPPPPLLFLQRWLSALFTQGCEDHLIMAPGYLSLLPFQPSESCHHCAECLDRQVISGGGGCLVFKQNDTTVIAAAAARHKLANLLSGRQLSERQTRAFKLAADRFIPQETK